VRDVRNEFRCLFFNIEKDSFIYRHKELESCFCMYKTLFIVVLLSFSTKLLSLFLVYIFLKNRINYILPDIRSFLFRTSRWLSFRTSGFFFGYRSEHSIFFHSDLPSFSFRTPGLFQKNGRSERTTRSDIRNKKQGRKGTDS
jgi:hypothetical protein